MKPARAFLPVLAAACGIATFSVMDALMKGASMALGVYTALLWRNLLGAALCLPVWLAAPGRAFPTRAMLGVHAFRSALVCSMASLFFWGLVRTPMAVGMALSFIAPLIALYLSALFLGEPVTRRALLASLIALVGVGVVAFGRLGGAGALGADSRAGLVAILCSAVLYAANLVMQRHQAQRAGPAEIALFQSLFIALLMVPLSPWLALWPGRGAFDLARLGLVGAAAALASVSLGLLSWGWARAAAHRLLPVEYSAFVWSALCGWWWFGERPSLWTLGGVVLIVGGVWVGTARAKAGDLSENFPLPEG
jgi:S-adenosylmethionine uptake transporter